LIDKCTIVKSNKCKNFYRNPNEIFLNNPSCKYGFEDGHFNILDFSDKMMELTFLKYYKEYENKCENLISNPVDKCNKLLEQHEECLIDFSKIKTDEDLLEKCYLSKSNKCYTFLMEGMTSKYPIYAYAQKFQKFDLLELNNEYKIDIYMYCNNIDNTYVREHVISNCLKNLKNDDIMFEYMDEITDDELSQKCEKLSNYDFTNDSECILAGNYIDIEDYSRKISNNIEICDHFNDKEYYIDKCKRDLSVLNKLCYLNPNPIDDIELENGCMAFLSEDCKIFYDNPFYYFPSCDFVQKYYDFEIFKMTPEIYNFFEEKCNNFKIIED